MENINKIICFQLTIFNTVFLCNYFGLCEYKQVHIFVLLFDSWFVIWKLKRYQPLKKAFKKMKKNSRITFKMKSFNFHQRQATCVSLLLLSFVLPARISKSTKIQSRQKSQTKPF